MTFQLKPYIEALIHNVDQTTVPAEVDVVFDSGGLNGFMALGVAMYLRVLEEQGALKVRRVSGCSAGAMVALMYLIDIFYDIEPFFVDLLAHYHCHRNLGEYMVKMREIVGEHLTDDMSELNGRLYITFFDCERNRQVVVSQYANREELIHCLARSSHIPYISNDVFKYEGRYVDGVSPYLFNDQERPVLFVKLVHMFNVGRFLNVRNEANSHSRVLEGIADANMFFTRGGSHMCSYVEKWWWFDFLLLRAHILIFLAVVAIVGRLRFLSYFAPTMCARCHHRIVDWFKN